jgi:hypothetical protein
MLKNIPDWLYEPLPYLYALLGLIATIVLEHSLGKLSGVMLISAGFVVWNLRFTYRRHRRRPRKRDLSWGVNQRMHPPKETKKGGNPHEAAHPKPIQEEEEDF